MEQQFNGPDTPQLIDRWLEIFVDRLHMALDDYDIGKLDGNLWKSIVGHMIRSGKDIDSVIVEFLQHGRFNDMGVGRGVPIGSRKALGDEKFSKKRNERGQLHKYSRKPKPWYSKAKTREIARLRELLATNRADFMLHELENFVRQAIIPEIPA